MLRKYKKFAEGHEYTPQMQMKGEFNKDWYDIYAKGVETLYIEQSKERQQWPEGKMFCPEFVTEVHDFFSTMMLNVISSLSSGL